MFLNSFLYDVDKAEQILEQLNNQEFYLKSLDEYQKMKQLICLNEQLTALLEMDDYSTLEIVTDQWYGKYDPAINFLLAAVPGQNMLLCLFQRLLQTYLSHRHFSLPAILCFVRPPPCDLCLASLNDTFPDIADSFYRLIYSS